MAAVTCQEIRELFSARLDEALSAEERARLEAHLATCIECPVEWRRFERAVGLLRATAPARAPAGFVDRVLAARPRPWYRQLARDLFVPWPVKLPLEAAAIVLVAGLAIVIFQRSPELQQAARAPEPAATVTAPPPPVKGAPDPVQAPARLERKRALPDEPGQRETESPPTGARPDSTAARDAAPPAEATRIVAESRPNSAEAPEVARRTEANQERAGATARQVAPPAPAGRESRDQTLSARISWLARLTVADQAAAERVVGHLVSRVGGQVHSRSEEPGATVLSLTVPADRWDEVRRALQTLGTLRLEGDRGRAADPLPITLRLER